jgi:hypothetical protein
MKYLVLFALLILTGCITRPQKPGSASFLSPSGFTGSVKQPENPKDDSTQDYDRIQDIAVPLQPGDKIPGTDQVAGKVMTVHIKVEEHSKAKVGAAQKDTAREMAAKLSSLKGVVWIGVILLVFGAASAFYPPLKVIVGSVTTSAVCAAVGLGLIVLPSLIVGHEVLIMCVGVGAVLIYFFAHRHGHLRGQLTNLLEKK